MAGESAAAAECAAQCERAAVALQYVFYNCQAQPRSSGRPGPAGVDAINPLREARDVLRGNPHSGVGHREVSTLLVHPPTHLDRALGRGVLCRVVHQVGQCRMDLGLVADEMSVRVDSDPDIARMRGPSKHVLSQDRHNGGYVDRFPTDNLVRFLEPRQREEVSYDSGHAVSLAPHFRIGALQITVQRRVLAQSLEVTADHSEWRAQLVRGIRHEIPADGFEPHLPRDITHEQQLLPLAVGHNLQREIAVLGRRRPDDDRIRIVLHRQVSSELGLAQQVLDTEAKIGCTSQVEKTARHPVEPDDFALRIQYYDAVGKRGRGALQLAYELYEALFVKTLTPMQTDNLRNDLAPDSAHIGCVRIAAVPQPPFDAEEIRELPGEVDHEGTSEASPRAAEQPTDP